MATNGLTSSLMRCLLHADRKHPTYMYLAEIQYTRQFVCHFSSDKSTWGLTIKFVQMPLHSTCSTEVVRLNLTLRLHDHT